MVQCCHINNHKKHLIFPGKSAFFYYIYKPCNKQPYKRGHSSKSTPAQFTKINCIWIKENHFHIKQYKKNSHQEVFDSHWLPCIAFYFNTTFKILQLIRSFSFRAKKMGECHYSCNKTDCKKKLDPDWQVVPGVINIICLEDKKLHGAKIRQPF